MGRELRRVPLDFDWPIGEVWDGYLCPLTLPTCRSCDGVGYGPEARAISNTFYPHQILGPNADALAWHDKIGQAEVDHLLTEGRLRTWVDGKWQALPRLADEVNEENRRPGMGGHDAINRMILVRFRCEKLGIDPSCPPCDGHGDIATEQEREQYENWESTEPPTGEGFQMWETTSEGSPQTPVFKTLGELAEYCADHCNTFGSLTASAEGWEQMLGDGTVSAVIAPGIIAI